MIKRGSCWQILEIEPTTNKREIKQAYARLLKIYHPEDNPEEFKVLENAYKQALQYKSDVKKTFSITMEQSDMHKEILEDNNSEIKKENKDHAIYLHEDMVKQDKKEQDNNRKKKHAIYIEKDIVEQQDIKIEDDASYIIKKVRFLLENDLSAITIDKIFKDYNVVKNMQKIDFKRDIEILLIEFIDKMDWDALSYVNKIVQEYNLEEVKKKLYKDHKGKKKHGQKSSNGRNVAIIVWIVLAIVAMGIIGNSKSENENTLTEEQRRNIVDSYTYESQNNYVLEGSKSFCTVNRTYLNGVTVDVDDSTVTIKDASGTTLLEKEVDNFTCELGSPLIVLNLENGYQIYDTGTKYLYPEIYRDYVVVSVEDNGMMQKGPRILVLDIDDNWYLLNIAGEKEILIDDSITISEETTVIHIQNGKVVE